MMNRNKQIKSFIGNIINKDYATASTKLKAVVESKLKEKIVKATKKDLF